MNSGVREDIKDELNYVIDVLKLSQVWAEWIKEDSSELSHVSEREIATQALVEGYDVYFGKCGYYGDPDFLIAKKGTNLKDVIDEWNEQENLEGEEQYTENDFRKINKIEEIFMISSI